jgi:hypothetical protein
MLCSRLRAILLGAAVASALCGCAGTYAEEGAKQGFVAGAVAGAVGSLFWGGNVLESAAVGAVTSAAAGAAIGGMNKKPEEAPAPAASTQAAAGSANAEDVVQRDRALEERIGPQNFDAARLLARCQHDSAIEAARKAYETADTDERRAYSLMIEAVSAEEKGDTATAAAVYPRFVELAPSHAPVEKARSEALSGILKVQQARKAHGLPPLCG